MEERKIDKEKLKDSLQNVDNAECILVEFAIESDSVAVGFLSWIKEDIDRLNDFIVKKGDWSYVARL